jgi:hypothetical protein
MGNYWLLGIDTTRYQAQIGSRNMRTRLSGQEETNCDVIVDLLYMYYNNTPLRKVRHFGYRASLSCMWHQLKSTSQSQKRGSIACITVKPDVMWCNVAILICKLLRTNCCLKWILFVDKNICVSVTVLFLFGKAENYPNFNFLTNDVLSPPPPPPPRL